MGDVGKHLELKGAFFIHLLNTGGQPSFQDVLPLLLEVPCTYIQVFNAALSLDERVPISFCADDHTRVCLEERAELSEDIMLCSFSSMQTMAHKCSKELASFLQTNSPPPQLRIFVVGTHKDEINPPSLHNTQIWALLLEFLYSLPFALQGRTWYQIVGQNPNNSAKEENPVIYLPPS